MKPLRTTAGRVAVVALVQLVLVGVAVAPQLSARLTGEEYLLRVAPVDPIDPFRGAYVDLGYPDLADAGRLTLPGERGTVFVVLVEGDDGVMVGGEVSRDRPDAGPYLRCDDSDWRLRCGIESLFLSQEGARDLETTVAAGTALARVRVDGRGNAALIDVEAG
jgi:uncharacterized membrane-anchored protein